MFQLRYSFTDAGCVRCSRAAAREKERRSETIVNAFKPWKSIVYIFQIFIKFMKIMNLRYSNMDHNIRQHI